MKIIPEQITAKIRSWSSTRSQGKLAERMNTLISQMRERTSTAVCRTADGIEWTSWKVRPDGAEKLQQKGCPVDFFGSNPEQEQGSEQEQGPDVLSETIAEELTGDITVSLPTSKLLLRVMSFPSIDVAEIAEMVEFQVDKISPFPRDQLAVSHEVVGQDEEASLVLLAIAQRNCIDAIGDAFEARGVRVHGIDARALGWFKLLRDEGHVAVEGCEIFLIDDRIDTSLLVSGNGRLLALRAVDADLFDAAQSNGLAEEIGYTLTTLETEQTLEAPAGIHLWSMDPVDPAAIERLTESAGVPVDAQDLSTLPPLSEGIFRRTLSGPGHIELVPAEWIEHVRRMRMRRQFIYASSFILSIWLLVMLVFYSTFKVREFRLNRVERQLASVQTAGDAALENRKNLKTLKLYTDRSDSALECLRELTLNLPLGDIKFASYNYKKGKGVTLRGAAETDESVYDFFEALTDSMLFKGLKDQSVNTKVIKGVRSAVFTVTLDLPEGEEEQ